MGVSMTYQIAVYCNEAYRATEKRFNSIWDALTWADTELVVPWQIKDSNGRVRWESDHGKRLFVRESQTGGRWVPIDMWASKNYRKLVKSFGGEPPTRLRRVKTSEEACEIGESLDPKPSILSRLDQLEWAT